MFEDLRELVEIKSVDAPRSRADAPFGQGLRNALDWFLNKASSYGLKVGEGDGYYGYADYGDPDAPVIGVLCHLDVVPASDDAFIFREDEKAVYGRGVADDKGAIAMMLDLMREFRENRVRLNRRLRLIVGCNEEKNSECIGKYRVEQEIPMISLVPDSDFPVVCSEKSILHTALTLIADDVFAKNVLSLNAGDRYNVIPNLASVVIVKPDTDDLFGGMASGYLQAANAKKDDFTVVDNGNTYTITAQGKEGHAMCPENGENAIWKIFALLRGLYPSSGFISNVWDKLCRYDATGVLGLNHSNESGKLTMNVGWAKTELGLLTLGFDFRLPITAMPDDIESRLLSSFPGGTINRDRYSEGFCVPEDSETIKILMTAYRAVTHDNFSTPIHTGGGTYARELPNAVAFGIAMPHKDNNIHRENEFIEKKDLIEAREIYRRAILELDEKL